MSFTYSRSAGLPPCHLLFLLLLFVHHPCPLLFVVSAVRPVEEGQFYGQSY